MTEINKQIAGGVDPETYADEARAVKETVSAATAARAFYLRAARAVTDEEAEARVKDLEKMRSPQEAWRALLVKLDALRLARPSTRVMPGVDLGKVGDLLKKIAEHE